ncbi:hypothetical protein HKW98_05035 [Stutzerimonas urumqiensis]|uniref:hypothetical protein n=1 Tax=Stutzerimonas urumqiensis TaxID=638269 RepID=UPI003BA93E87
MRSIRLTGKAQLAIGLALAALMAMTRGQHAISVDSLPSASWAVFFLAGLFLRPRWTFAGFFVLASLLDFGSMAAGTVSDWCLSPAYWALVPAYGSLWFAGRLFAAQRLEGLAGIAGLAATLAVVAMVAYVFSGGGFYFFSGHYPDADLAGFLPRIAEYYPRYLSVMAMYVALAALLHSLAGALVVERTGEVRP